jgi:hypothetical protein
VDNVDLPPWASSAAAFIALNRMALESSYASSHIHEWIDLIFGVNQRSEDANNIFHPFSYQSAIDDDPDSLTLIQDYAVNFGIVPSQLFSSPHPARTFRPPEHGLFDCAERFTTFTLFCRFEQTPLKFAMCLNSIRVLYGDGCLSFYCLSPKTGLTLIKSSQIELPSPIDDTRIILPAISQSVIVSATWSHSLTIASPSRPKSELPTVHSSAITAMAADGDYCVTGAGDSSIVVWNLTTSSVEAHVVAHTCGIAALAVCARSEIVVSCDVSGLLVYSGLRTGGFLQKVKLEKVPGKILVSSIGFCVLIVEEETESGIQIEAILLDFSGRLLAKHEVQGKCTASTIFENKDASAFLVVAQETNVVYIFSLWDLNQVRIGPVVANVIDISYDEDELKLYLLLENREVHTCSFAARP